MYRLGYLCCWVVIALMVVVVGKCDAATNRLDTSSEPSANENILDNRLRLPSVAVVRRPFSFAVVDGGLTTGFAATGLPSGLGINATNGLITGVPVVSGTFDATLWTTNSLGTNRTDFAMDVLDPLVSTFAGTGQAGGVNGPARFASFEVPYDVDVDSDGVVYVADAFNHSIRRISTGGMVSTLAGGGVAGSVDGVGSNARFSHPHGVAVDAAGVVYSADWLTHRIRKISPLGFVSTLAGSGNLGDADEVGLLASFRWPEDVEVDAEGNVYVADRTNHKIRKITPDGMVSTLAGNGTEGDADGNGLAASFKWPYGVAVYGDGSVFVADTGNNKIRKISPSGEVSTIAGSGQLGSSDGTGPEASFHGPRGIAVDAMGNLFVADTGNHLIRRVDCYGQVITLSGTGNTGNRDGNGIDSSFDTPTGISLNPDGNLLVADAGNDKIRKITLRPLPQIQVQPESTTGFLDGILTLQASAAGEANRYQWFKDGQAITGATNAVFQHLDLNPGDAGTYAVEISNAFGTTTSREAKVTIKSRAELLSIPSRPGDLPDGLVAWWKLDEVGGTRFDSSGNTNHLDDNNTVESVPEENWGVGRSARFVSMNSEFLSIQDADQRGLDLTGPFTIACWAKLSAQDTHHFIASKWDSQGPGFAYEFHFNSFVSGQFAGSNNLEYKASGNGDDTAQSNSGRTVIQPGGWHHAAVVYNGEFFALYLDGNIDETSPTYIGPINDSSAPFLVGAFLDSGVPSGFFNGLMSDLAVWNRDLTPLEIKSLALGLDLRHSTYRPGEVPIPAAGIWLLNELSNGGAPVPRYDSSGNGLTLTDNNTVGSVGGFIEGVAASFNSSHQENLAIEHSPGNPLDINGVEQSISIVAWIYPTSTHQSSDVILGKWANDIGYQLQYQSYVHKRIEFLIGDENGEKKLAQSDPVVEIERWYHVAAVYDAKNDEMQVYVDGIASGAIETHSTGIGSNDHELRIGGTSDRNDLTWHGRLADVAVFPTALSGSEIRALATGLPIQRSGITDFSGGMVEATRMIRPEEIKALYNLERNNLEATNASGLMLPVVASSATYAVVGVGNKPSLNVDVTGKGPFIYEWFRNGTLLIGEQGNTLSLSEVGPAEVGQYSVKVSGLLGATTNDVSTVTYHTDPSFDRGFQLGGNGEFNYAWDLATDSAGNVLIGGAFKGTLDFDPGPAAVTRMGGIGNAFIGKYTANQDPLWVAVFSGTNNSDVRALTTDSSGNVFVTGTFFGTIDFDPGVGEANLDTGSPIERDVFVVKLDAHGNHLWSRRLAGTGSAFPNAIAVENGKVYVAGEFSGQLDADPGVDTRWLVSAGVQDMFLVQLDGDGDFQWASHGAGESWNEWTGMAAFPSGGVVVCGRNSQEVTFDGDLTIGPAGAGNFDGIIARYDEAGNRTWLKYFPGSSVAPEGMAIDDLENIYVTGSFSGAFSTDGKSGPISLAVNGSEPNTFLFALDALGEVCWARRWGGVGAGAGLDVAVDNRGSVFVAGRFIGPTIDLDPGTETDLFPGGSNEFSPFLVKLNDLGVYHWGATMAGERSQVGGITVGGDGRLLVAGFFHNEIDFHLGQFATNHLSGPAVENERDIFVAQIDPGIEIGFEPAVYRQPSNQVASFGSTITLSAGVGGVEPLFFQWKRNGTNLIGQTSPQLELSGVASEDVGTYWVEVANAHGAVSSATATLSATNSADLEFAFNIGSGPGGSEQANDVALDSGGNIYVTGFFTDPSTDFDPGTNTSFLDATGGAIFVAKYGPSGDHLWSIGIRDPLGANSSGNAIDVDALGNVYVTGFFGSGGGHPGQSIDFDPSDGIAERQGFGVRDVFVLKLDSDGQFSWARTFGSTNWDAGLDIAVDSSGNAYVCGMFENTVDLAHLGADYDLISAGRRDIFVARFTSTGTFSWAKRVGGAGADDDMAKMDLDHLGNPVLLCQFQDTVDFDPGPGEFFLTSSAPSGVGTATLKLNSAGEFIWAKGFRTDGTSVSPGDLAVDSVGNIIGAIHFNGSVDLDPDPVAEFQVHELAGGGDLALFKWDASGNVQWGKVFGSTNSKWVRSLAIDSAGQAYVFGTFRGVMDLDPGTNNLIVSAPGFQSAFISKFDSNGDFIWGGAIGGGRVDAGGMAVGDAEKVVITGYFDQPADFDPGPENLTLTDRSDTGSDLFVAKYLSAVVVLPNPQIEVRGSGQPISNLATVADTRNGTDFGIVRLGTAGAVRSFVVTNAGTAPLSVSGISVPEGFSLESIDQFTVRPGEASSVAVRLNAGVMGLKLGNLVLTNDDPSVSEFTFALSGIVSEAPQIVSQPEGVIARVGTNVTMSVAANGFPLNYQWRLDSIPIDGATNAELARTDITLLDEGDYDVVITNFFGSVTSAVARLTISVPVWTHSHGAGVVSVSPAKSKYGLGETVTLTGIPQQHHRFVGWRDGETNQSRVVTLGATNVYTAIFTNTVVMEHSLVRLWETNYGGLGDESLYSAVADGEGGYVLAGISKSGGSGTKETTNYGEWDVWITRIDRNGAVLWEKTFGGTLAEGAPQVMRAFDGGFMVAAWSNSQDDGNKSAPNHGSTDYWLLKLDDSGNLVWDQTIGGAALDELFVALSGNETYLIGGVFGSAPERRTKLIGLDGTELWSTNFPYGAFTLDRTGAFASVGSPFFGGGEQSIHIFDTNASLLAKIDLSTTNNIFELDSTADAGFVVGGSTGAWEDGSLDIYVSRVNRDGSLLWERMLAGDGNDVPQKIVATKDGGVLVAAVSGSQPGGDKTVPRYGTNDIWLVKLDSTGSIEWQESLGGIAGSSSWVNDVLLESDGTILLAGTSTSPAGGNKLAGLNGNFDGESADFWVMKLLPRAVPEGAPLISSDNVYPISGVLLSVGDARVELNSTSANARITYTTDGSTPDRSSPNVYNDPLVFSNTVVLRSYAFDAFANSGVEGNSAQIVPVDVKGGGTVRLVGVSVDPRDGSKVVHLVAEPEDGWTHLAWRGDVTGDTDRISLQIQPTNQLEIQVIFGTSVDVSSSSSSEGQVHVWPNQNNHPAGGTVRLTAIPEPGFKLLYWAFEGVGFVESNRLSVTISNQTPRLRAVFAPLATNEITATVVVEGNGQVLISTEKLVYSVGDELSLTAIPDAGYQFDGFGGDLDISEKVASVILNSSMVLTARFSPFSGSAPSVLRQPTGRIVFQGESRVFDIWASGADPLTYQWRLNGVAIPGANGTNYSILSADSLHQGIYDVVVSNPAGSVISEGVRLQVVELDIPWRGMGGVGGAKSAVHDIVIHEGQLIVGGKFDHYVRMPGGVGWISPDGDIDASWPTFPGRVTAAISDHAGGCYLAWENHQSAGLIEIAHVGADREIVQEFQVRLTGGTRVHAMALVEDRLFVAGDFSHVNGLRRGGFAEVSTSGSVADWDPLARPNEFDSNDVRAIEITPDGKAIFVGGRFEAHNGGHPRADLVRLDLSENLIDPQFAAELGNGAINAICLHDTTLFVGGSFLTIGGYSAELLAALNPETGTPDLHWNIKLFHGSSEGVQDLLALDGCLYVAGRFTRVEPPSGQRRVGLAAIDLNFRVVTDWDPRVDDLGSAKGLATDGTNIFAVGDFVSVAGQSRLGAVAISTNGTGNDLSAWNPNIGLPEGIGRPGIEGITMIDGQLAIFGDFNEFGRVPRQNLLSIDLATGELNDWSPEPNGTVFSLETSGPDLIVGGLFTHMAGAEREGMGVFRGDSSGFRLTDLAVEGVDAPQDFVVWDGRIYVAARKAVHVYHENGQHIRNFPLEGDAFALCLDDGVLFVGGAFSEIDGVPVENLAAIRLIDNAIVDLVPSADKAVYDLAAQDGAIYVAGDFTKLNEVERSRAGAFIPGRKLGNDPENWSPDVKGSSSSKAVVNAVASAFGRVAIAGAFTDAGRRDQGGLAILDTERGDAGASRLTVLDGEVKSMVVGNGGLLALGGDFQGLARSVGPIAAANLAIVGPTGGLALASMPESRSVTAGGDLSLQAEVFGQGPVSYQWYFNGVSLAGETRSQLNLTDLQANQAGTYHFVANNTHGAVTGPPIEVSVPPAPQAQLNDPVRELSPGGDLVIDSGATDLLSVQWKRNGVIIPGETSPVLIWNNVSIRQSGVFTVLLGNGQENRVSEPIEVLIRDVDSQFADHFADRLPLTGAVGSVAGSNVGASRELSEPHHVKRGGDRSVWFRWLAPITAHMVFDTEGSSIDTQLAIYTNAPGSTSIGALRRVTEDYGNGSFRSSRVGFRALANVEYVIVVDSIRRRSGAIVLNWEQEATDDYVPVIVTASEDRTITAATSTITFQAEVDASGQTVTYQWFHLLDPIADATNASLTLSDLSVASIGQYRVRARIGQQEVFAQAGKLEFGPEATVQTKDNFNDLYQSSGLAPASPGSTSESLIPGLSIQPGETLSQSLWLDGTSTADYGERVVARTGLGNSRWLILSCAVDGLLVINTIGSTTDPVIAVYRGTELANLQLIDSDRDRVGDGRNAQLEIPVIAHETYFLAIDRERSVDGVGKVNLTLGQAPRILRQPKSVIAPEGDDVTFSIEVTGNPPPSLQWLRNGVAIPGATNTTYTVTGAAAADNAQYRVVVANAVDFESSGTAELFVNELKIGAVALVSPALAEITMNVPANRTIIVQTSPDGANWQEYARYNSPTGSITFSLPRPPATEPDSHLFIRASFQR